MDRRKFCKLTALLAAGAALMPSKAIADGKKSAAVRSCRIQVIRRECFFDLQSRYLDDPEAGPCPLFKCGQELTVTPANISDFENGKLFCPKAWACIRQHVMQTLGQSGEQCGTTHTGKSIIACCSDGTRPVVFKITPA